MRNYDPLLCSCRCACRKCPSKADELTNRVVLDAIDAVYLIQLGLKMRQVVEMDAVYDVASYILMASGISPHHLSPARWDVLWSCIDTLLGLERHAHERALADADAVSEVIMSLSPNYAIHSDLFPPEEIDILQDRQDWEMDYVFVWRDASLDRITAQERFLE